MKQFVSATLLVFGALMANGEPCITPDGSEGNCVKILNCPSLTSLLRKKDMTQNDITLLKDSSCGFEESVPKVCCPNLCITSDNKQGTCAARSSCTHLSKTAEAKRCLGSNSICCPTLNTEGFSNCEKTLSSYPFPPNSYCCGRDGVTDIKMLYGGRNGPTEIDQYPWLALIEYQVENKKKIMCGGSLISGKYILTAAHCITGAVLKRGTPIAVRLGEYDTTKEVDCINRENNLGLECASANDTMTIPVESAIAHPQYDPVTKRHDIGLIRLKEQAPYTDYIEPICLPFQDYNLTGLPIVNLFAGGWGIGSTTHWRSMVKQDVLLPFVEQKDCQKSFGGPRHNITVWNDQICAGGEKGKNACMGDSGGTLMGLSGSFQALGVMSFGTICQEENMPTVYTKVYDYVDWIYSVIKP